MTDDEIESLPAGKETDILVAERVMRWSRPDPAAESWTRDGNTAIWENSGFAMQYDPMPCLPRYSECIEEAWKVVQALRERGCEVSVWTSTPARAALISHPAQAASAWWGVEIRDGHPAIPRGFHSTLCYGPTVPLAICRAALKVEAKRAAPDVIR